MMLVLLVLFQFSLVLRDRQNTYDTNANLSRRVSDGEEAWSQETSRTSEYFWEKKNIIFIGNASGSMGTAVTRWGTYIKQPVSSYDSLAAFEEGEETLPQMLILESETYALGETQETGKTGCHPCLWLPGRSEGSGGERELTEIPGDSLDRFRDDGA